MAIQNTLDWRSLYDSLAGSRADAAAKRAAQDLADKSRVSTLESDTRSQAMDRAEREAARQAGVYEGVYGGTDAGGVDQTTGNHTYAQQRQGMTGAPTRPGASTNVGYQDPYYNQTDKDVSNDVYSEDISSLDPYKAAQAELDKRQRMENIHQATAGAWETGGLSPARRMATEAKSPWDELASKLGKIQTDAAKREQDLQSAYASGLEGVRTANEAQAMGIENAPMDLATRNKINTQLQNEYPMMLARAWAQLNPGKPAPDFNDPIFKTRSDVIEATKLATQMYNNRQQELNNQYKVSQIGKANAERSNYGNELNDWYAQQRRGLTSPSTNTYTEPVDQTGYW